MKTKMIEKIVARARGMIISRRATTWKTGSPMVQMAYKEKVLVNNGQKSAKSRT